MRRSGDERAADMMAGPGPADEATRAEAARAPRGSTRRLSAIMFSDMVGFTAMMQEDETRARSARQRQRGALDAHIGSHGGRILQYYGDGALSVFDSAIEAVLAAIAIQQDLNRPPRVALRVGIHMGDVVYDEEGVFGDGVNVASRIQGLGSPGSVVVSAKVHDEIRNQPQLSAVTLGEFNLKNVRQPVEVFAIVAGGLTLPAPESLPSTARQQLRSVAVLPFLNMSADRDNEFFSDGITEELINVLTRVNGLHVTARTSTFAFKGRQADVREIATKLGVDTVLEGSVRRSGQRVRITAQLVDASNGYHIFSQTYDRTLDDVFETQDEIARAIVRAVEDRLTPERRQAALATARTGTAAHRLYLEGLHEFNRTTPEGTRNAIHLFRRALELDPQYASAWVGLARAHKVIARAAQGDVKENWDAAESAARRALELDPSQGEAHIVLGMEKLLWAWEFDAAYEELQKALSLSPGSAAVHSDYATYLAVIGEMERAVEEAEIAGQLDPLSLPMMLARADTCISAGRLQEAHALADRILEEDPTFRAAIPVRALALALQGRYQEASAELDRVVAITGDPYRWLAERGFAYAMLGRTDDARRNLEMLRQKQRMHPGLALEIDFYILMIGLGEYEEARRYLERAAEKRLAGVLFMINSSLWFLARRDPGFDEFLERWGLTRLKRTDRTA